MDTELDILKHLRDGEDDGKKRESGMTSMSEITYCTNMNCPFEKCERHLSHLKKYKGQKMTIKVANMGGVCRDYLAYVYDCIVEEEKNG